MTYKYLEVRRDIYEECSDKALKKFRTFKEMRNILRAFHWTLLALMIFALITLVIIFFLPISNIWGFIPAIIVSIVSIIGEFKTEKNYNKEARNKELTEHHIAYEEYINNIKIVLEKNGIDTAQKRKILKDECVEILEKHKQKYISVKSRVFDMLIGVPLGALISSLIYQNSETIANQICVIIVIGLIIISFSYIIKKIKFYSDGYFKDKHLLDVLNEVQYFE